MSLVPFDDRDGKIWFDGQLTPWRDAKIHVLTHGLHYAAAAFEGERAYGGKVFKSREHTERLHRSAEILGYKIPYTVDQIEKAKADVVAAMGGGDLYVRAIAWRGSEQMGVAAQAAKIHLAIAAWAWPSYFSPELLEKGIRLKWAPYRRPAPDTAPTASKASGLYQICTISKHDAEKDGFQDAMMLDYRGLLAEATGANVFLVQNGELHTPTPDCFLNGITRQTLIALAKENGFKVVERHIKPEELSNFDECFLTGTAAEVTPVSEVGEYKFKPGKACSTLINAYTEAVTPKKVAAE